MEDGWWRWRRQGWVGDGGDGFGSDGGGDGDWGLLPEGAAA